MALYLSETTLFTGSLADLAPTKLLITTINAHSYNVAQHDEAFAKSLQKSDVLLPDGISVVLAKRWLSRSVKTQCHASLKKIAGEDLFYYEMNRLNIETYHGASHKPAKAFFLGSNESTLQKIKERAACEFPNVELHTFSPPYKPEFSEADNAEMIEAVNAIQPDVLFIGMTAPKQEKWAYNTVNSGRLAIDNCHVCCIGAVFDFYAGTVTRAPQWVIRIGMEWFYRLIKEPRRMWKRYLVGNVKFVWGIVREKINH